MITIDGDELAENALNIVKENIPPLPR